MDTASVVAPDPARADGLPIDHSVDPTWLRTRLLGLSSGLIFLLVVALVPLLPVIAVGMGCIGAGMIAWAATAGLRGPLQWVPHLVAAAALLPLVITGSSGCSMGCAFTEFHKIGVIPIPLLGLVFHLLLALAIAYGYRLYPEQVWVRSAATALAIGASLGFIVVAWLDSTWCRWCWTAHCAMLTALFALIPTWRATAADHRVLLVATLVAGASVPGWFHRWPPAAPPSDADVLVAYLRSGLVSTQASATDISSGRTTQDAMRWGGATAPVRVVAVLQAGCPVCARTWPAITGLADLVTRGDVAVHIVMMPGRAKHGQDVADFIMAAGLVSENLLLASLDRMYAQPDNSPTLTLSDLLLADANRQVSTARTSKATLLADLRTDTIRTAAGLGATQAPSIYVARRGTVPAAADLLPLPISPTILRARVTTNPH